MKGLFVALAIVVGADASRADVRIADNTGGRIKQFVEDFATIRDRGERVIIDGACLSACTMVLGLVPRDRICVTERAVLGFHQAWMPGPHGQPIPSPIGTQTLWEIYPTNVKKWLNRKGGLQKKMIFLRGHELTALYQECH